MARAAVSWQNAGVKLALFPALLLAFPALADPPARLLAPVGPTCVSSPFGPRILPGKPKAGTYHYGIDLAVPVGAAVRASFPGSIASIHKRGPGGLEVVVQHAGFQTLYAHLGSVAPPFAEGKRGVAAGEKLGVVGRSGVSYGAHIYFEVIVEGKRIDPEPLLGIPRCGPH